MLELDGCEVCTPLGQMGLLFGFLVQFLLVLLENAVGLLGYQKPDIMDPRPPALRGPNIRRDAWCQVAQRRYSEAGHEVRLILESRELEPSHPSLLYRPVLGHTGRVTCPI